MAARRCSVDGINYPYDSRTAKCVVCGEPTDYFQNLEPDEDWADKVAAILERQAVDPVEHPDIPQVEARVIVRGDGLFVSRDDVYHSGVRMDVPLKPHTLIQIGALTFEIIEYVSEPNREYLVRTFSTALSDEDLARLAGV